MKTSKTLEYSSVYYFWLMASNFILTSSANSFSLNSFQVTSFFLYLQRYQQTEGTKESNNMKWVNPFHVIVLFLYPLKTSEILWFFDVFRGYRNGTLENLSISYQVYFGFTNTSIHSENFQSTLLLRSSHPEVLLCVVLQLYWKGTLTQVL